MTGLILGARRLWRVFFFANAVLVFLIFYPLFWPLVTNEKFFRTGLVFKRWYSKLILIIPGIRWKVHNHAHLVPGKAYIFCPNHTSYLDIVLSYVIFPVYFHMMGKAELTKVPLFKVFFKKMDIPVDRGSLKDSHRAFTRAGQDLDKGISIIIFPEATIPQHAPKLGRFKNGAFKLAIDKQVSIVPVTFINNWRLLPDGRKRKHGGKPGVAEIIIHRPIDTKGMTDEDLVDLKHQLFVTLDTSLRKKHQFQIPNPKS